MLLLVTAVICLLPWRMSCLRACVFLTGSCAACRREEEPGGGGGRRRSAAGRRRGVAAAARHAGGRRRLLPAAVAREPPARGRRVLTAKLPHCLRLRAEAPCVAACRIKGVHFGPVTMRNLIRQTFACNRRQHVLRNAIGRVG